MKIYHHQHHLLLEKSHLPDRRKLSTDVPFKESGTVKWTEFLQSVKVWLGSGRLKQGLVPESNLINRQSSQPDVSKFKIQSTGTPQSIYIDSHPQICHPVYGISVPLIHIRRKVCRGNPSRPRPRFLFKVNLCTVLQR